MDLKELLAKTALSLHVQQYRDWVTNPAYVSAEDIALLRQHFVQVDNSRTRANKSREMLSSMRRSGVSQNAQILQRRRLLDHLQKVVKAIR